MSAGATHLEQRAHRQIGRHWPTREEILDALEDAREAIRERDCAILALCLMRARPQPHDAAAERRVLGAMVVGRATLEDIAGLESADFNDERLFVAVREQLVAERRRPLRVRPSARRCPALAARARVDLRRRCIEGRLSGDTHAAEILYSLPWPAGCPRDAIATVRGLGLWRRNGS